MGNVPGNPDYASGIHLGTVVSQTGGAGSQLTVQPDDQLHTYHQMPALNDATYTVGQSVPFGYHNNNLQQPQVLAGGRSVRTAFGGVPVTFLPVGWLAPQGSDLRQGGAACPMPTSWVIDPNFAALAPAINPWESRIGIIGTAVSDGNVLIAPTERYDGELVGPGPTGLIAWDLVYSAVLTLDEVTIVDYPNMSLRLDTTQPGGANANEWSSGLATLTLQCYANGTPANNVYAPPVGAFLLIETEWLRVVDNHTFADDHTITVATGLYSTFPIIHTAGTVVQITRWIQGLNGAVDGSGIPQGSGVFLVADAAFTDTKVIISSKTAAFVADVGGVHQADMPIAAPSESGNCYLLIDEEFMKVTLVAAPATMPPDTVLGVTGSKAGQWLVTVDRAQFGSDPVDHSAGATVWLVEGLDAAAQAVAATYPTAIGGVNPIVPAIYEQRATNNPTAQWLGVVVMTDANGATIDSPSVANTTTLPPFTSYWYGLIETCQATFPHDPGSAQPGDTVQVGPFGSLCKIDVATGNVMWQIPAMLMISDIVVDQTPTGNGLRNVMYVTQDLQITTYPEPATEAPAFPVGTVRVSCYSTVDGTLQWTHDLLPVNPTHGRFIVDGYPFQSIPPYSTYTSKIFINGRGNNIVIGSNAAVLVGSSDPANVQFDYSLVGLSKLNGTVAWTTPLHNGVATPPFNCTFSSPFGINLGDLNGVVMQVRTSSSTGTCVDIVCVDENGSEAWRYASLPETIFDTFTYSYTPSHTLTGHSGPPPPDGPFDSGTDSSSHSARVLAVDPTSSLVLCYRMMHTAVALSVDVQPDPVTCLWNGEIFALNSSGGLAWTYALPTFPEVSVISEVATIPLDFGGGSYLVYYVNTTQEPYLGGGVLAGVAPTATAPVFAIVNGTIPQTYTIVPPLGTNDTGAEYTYALLDDNTVYTFRADGTCVKHLIPLPVGSALGRLGAELKLIGGRIYLLLSDVNMKTNLPSPAGTDYRNIGKLYRIL